ncbi:DUF523 domain-containing protein [Sulfurimonas sp.]
MSSARKRVIISACLLGEHCRYDGKTKEIPEVIKAYEGYEIIPFCPEAPLFGTPRERISVIKIHEQKHIITDNTHKDVTKLLQKEIENFCKAYPQVDAIVLKSKSPSCGYKTTPILDKNKNILFYDNGIAADIFTHYYPNIDIKDETGVNA